jgi:hypothetical protein
MATLEDPSSDSVADLERLAAAIDIQAYAVTLVTTQGRPHLHVTNRRAAQLTERIYCDGEAYWWGWSERIADVGDVGRAAESVSRVLRSIGDRAHARRA